MILEASSSWGITWFFRIYLIEKTIKCKAFIYNFQFVRWINEERCKKDPATQGKEKSDCISLSFGKGGLRKDLVLEMSWKEFVLEKAFDKMAV